MSLHSSTLSALLSDFKARYPMGAIVAEFLTIHQDSYVVRALAQSGGITLASGMASAPAIEAAEDRAKIRALEALGIRVASSFDLPVPPLADESVSTAIAPLELPLLSQSVLQPTSQSAAIPFSQSAASTSPSLEQDFAARQPISEPISAPILEPLLSFPQVDRSPELMPEPIVTSESYNVSSDDGVEQLSSEVLPELPPEPLPETLPELDLPSPSFLSEPPAAKPSKTKRKTESAPTSSASPAAETPEEPAKEPSNEPNDRSNEIARISVEMKRLGWTTEQGRRHLKETYGKRSRQELNDSELMDFLSFLESQPSSAQSLF